MQAFAIQHIIFKFISPIFIVINILGNLITFIVFSRKTFRNKSIAFYGRIMNIIDSICSFLMIRAIYQHGYEINTNLSNQFLCLFGSYLTLSLSVISSYLLCVVSFDRMIAIVFPKRFDFLKKKSFQILITLFTIFSQLIFYIGYPIHSNLTIFRFDEIVGITRIPIVRNSSSISNTDSNLSIDFIESFITIVTEIRFCLLFEKNLERTYRILDLVNSTIIPFTLMITFTIITIVKINKSRKNTSSHSSLSKQAIKVKRRDINFALVCVALNLVYLIFYTPAVTFQLLEVQNFAFLAISTIIGQHFFYFYFGSMFFINIFVNKIFKREIYIMLNCRAQSNNKLQNSINTQTSQYDNNRIN
jgi:hypothetical protein